MFCRKCGKEIPDDSKFCPKCGTVIEKDVTEKISLQKDETVTAVQENVSANYAAIEPPKSDTADITQTALDEIKPENSNKPLIISSVFGVVILAVLAAILIPLFTSKNIDIDLNSEDSVAELNSKSIEAYDQFKYHLLNDDTYVIDGYTGNSPDVIIPDTIDGKPVSAIGGTAFSGSSVESIIIGKNVWEIGPSAFSNCNDLHTVEMLSNDDFIVDIAEGDILIHSIGYRAFAYCYNLETFIFPQNNYTKIAAEAFSRCKALKNVELTGIWSIGYAAFKESGLQSVNLHSGETASAVFADCKDLKEVTLGNLVDISEEMFSGCTSLETVTWNFSPYMDNKIGNRAFYGCTSFKQFNTIDTPITYPSGFSEFIDEFRSLGAKDIVIGKDAFKKCGSFKDPEMTFTTVLNNKGEYIDKWDYIFYDDPLVYGNWDIFGWVDSKNLDDWTEGKVQPHTLSDPILKNLKLYSNGNAVITYSNDYSDSEKWTRGYVCDSRLEEVKKIVTATIKGIDYLAYEHKSGDYSREKRVSGYFVLKRNGTLPQNAADHKKRIEDYTGKELAEMSYKEFTDNFGMPDGGYFWGRAQYLNSAGSQVVAEVGYDSEFDRNSSKKLKYIIIYGGKEMNINNEIHLGEGLDYYNNHLSFDVYNALKMGAGDHGAVWYEVGIQYSNRSGTPLYTVDLRLTEGDYVCYAAKITALQ